MGIPAIQAARIGTYILRQKLSGRRRFPLVLMLEPLFRCNLRCKGCGKITYSKEIMDRQLSKQECLDAARECGAPVVSIPGGEPLLHPDIPAIVDGLTAQKRFIYLCTNAQLLAARMDEFRPSPYLNFSVHLDGLRERHDAMVCKEGAYDRAVSAMRKALEQGFRVTTNTTFFKGQTPEAAAAHFDALMALGVEGMTVSAAFSYEAAADQNGFMSRQEAMALFRNIFRLGQGRGWRFNHSSLYLDFLAGREDYACAPWGTPAHNVLGWQRPCYLLDDGYAASFRELMEETDWERYGLGRDPRCRNCMVHCGFEPSAVIDAVHRPLKAWRSSRMPVEARAG